MQRDPGPATAKQQRQLRALRQLAEDASRYLRRHASAPVRLAAALLLAASLAACSASATDTNMVETRAVAPLSQEVMSGLPRGPGTYPVVHESVFRDQRGVYQLEWLDPGSTDANGHVAHVSRLRLIRDDTLALEMPAGGGDPVLHLPEDENVGLIEQAQVAAVQAGPTYYPSPYSYWHPFGYGPSVILLGRPAYYDPPRTIVVDRTPAGTGGSTASRPMTVDGGSFSETAKPPSARVTGVTSAVSGRAGGTGSGSAVTSRNITSGASSTSSGPRAGTSGSSGTSGAAGASSGVTSSGARSSTSGGSVTAPRSGGFSAGAGSSGGSAAS